MIEMIEMIQQTEGIWQYVVLFLLAILPLVDIFFIVPVGIAFGLSPIVVGIVGFAGNYLMVLLLGLFFREVAEWREKRRTKKGITQPSKKETRARRIWDRYGLPGLALFGPILFGTDLVAFLALMFGSSRYRVISWMGISLVLWTVAVTIGSVYGFSYLDLI